MGQGNVVRARLVGNACDLRGVVATLAGGFGAWSPRDRVGGDEGVGADDGEACPVLALGGFRGAPVGDEFAADFLAGEFRRVGLGSDVGSQGVTDFEPVESHGFGDFRLAFARVAGGADD